MMLTAFLLTAMAMCMHTMCMRTAVGVWELSESLGKIELSDIKSLQTTHGPSWAVLFCPKEVLTRSIRDAGKREESPSSPPSPLTAAKA